MSARELYKEIAENCCIEFGDYPLNNIYNLNLILILLDYYQISKM